MLYMGPFLPKFMGLGRCLRSSTDSALIFGAHSRLLLDVHLFVKSFLLQAIIAVHKRPSLDALWFSLFLCRNILEYLLLLLFRAIKRFILLFKLSDCMAWVRHIQAARSDLLPVYISKEWMPLYLDSTFSTCAQSLARVAIQQVHNQVLSLLWHAHWEL